MGSLLGAANVQFLHPADDPAYIAALAKKKRPPAPAKSPYTEWWTDFFWHRVMFKQSVFQWAAEDVLGNVLRLLGSRTEFSKPQHLVLVRDVHEQVMDAELLICRAMLHEMNTITSYWGSGEARKQIYDQIGFQGWEAEELALGARFPLDPHELALTQQDMRGWPSQNPISRLWELRQIQTYHLSVSEQLDALRYELGMELSEWMPAAALAAIDKFATPIMQRAYVEARGEAGDPRRALRLQTYTPLPPEPTPATEPVPLPRRNLAKRDLLYW